MEYKVFTNLKFSRTSNPRINSVFVTIYVNQAQDAEQAIHDARAFLTHNSIAIGAITGVEMAGMDK